MFTAVLMDAYHHEQPGIHIAYRTDGHHLNSRRMQAPTRESTTTVHDLLFADICKPNQALVDCKPPCVIATNTKPERVRKDPGHVSPRVDRNPPHPRHAEDPRHHPPSSPPATVTVKNTTCPTPATSVATSEYLPSATSNTTTATSTSDGDSVPTCPHCDRTLTSHIGLVGMTVIELGVCLPEVFRLVKYYSGTYLVSWQYDDAPVSIQCPEGILRRSQNSHTWFVWQQ
ncbi:unnamed protein product [Schistocephalus solidus]|uniref:Uncharacterized protein n=1 Tax=Schistocephalus solidus TaxID=70667 RepID=A0A183SIF8_SCHSO|nr:unnamed protein product [Schistocephalus solidus]